MTGFTLASSAVDEHAQALTDIAGGVRNAGTSGRTLVGVMDFGALFVPLMGAVNVSLTLVDDAVARHESEIIDHRDEFLRTAQKLVETDDGGAQGITREGPR